MQKSCQLLWHTSCYCKLYTNAFVNLLPKRSKRTCKNHANDFVNLLPKTGMKIAYACKNHANTIGMKIAKAKPWHGSCRAKD
tara:strand:+ start:347 stop:592 length:246 start_codon:yes stop_codon:yes gene_type:complete